MKHAKNILVVLGVFLISAGIGVVFVSNFEITSLETMLENENLSAEEIWAFEGAIQWWRQSYFTLIVPVSAVLLLGGIATVMSVFLLSVLRDITD